MFLTGLTCFFKFSRGLFLGPPFMHDECVHRRSLICELCMVQVHSLHQEAVRMSSLSERLLSVSHSCDAYAHPPSDCSRSLCFAASCEGHHRRYQQRSSNDTARQVDHATVQPAAREFDVARTAAYLHWWSSFVSALLESYSTSVHTPRS